MHIGVLDRVRSAICDVYEIFREGAPSRALAGSLARRSVWSAGVCQEGFEIDSCQRRGQPRQYSYLENCSSRLVGPIDIAKSPQAKTSKNVLEFQPTKIFCYDLFSFFLL